MGVKLGFSIIINFRFLAIDTTYITMIYHITSLYHINFIPQGTSHPVRCNTMCFTEVRNE